MTKAHRWGLMSWRGRLRGNICVCLGIAPRTLEHWAPVRVSPEQSNGTYEMGVRFLLVLYDTTWGTIILAPGSKRAVAQWPVGFSFRTHDPIKWAGILWLGSSNLPEYSKKVRMSLRIWFWRSGSNWYFLEMVMAMELDGMWWNALFSAWGESKADRFQTINCY